MNLTAVGVLGRRLDQCRGQLADALETVSRLESDLASYRSMVDQLEKEISDLTEALAAEGHIVD